MYATELLSAGAEGPRPNTRICKKDVVVFLYLLVISDTDTTVL